MYIDVDDFELILPENIEIANLITFSIVDMVEDKPKDDTLKLKDPKKNEKVI